MCVGVKREVADQMHVVCTNILATHSPARQLPSSRHNLIKTISEKPAGHSDERTSHLLSNEGAIYSDTLTVKYLLFSG